MMKKIWSRRNIIVFGFKFFGSSYLLALTPSQLKKNEESSSFLSHQETKNYPLYDCIVIGAGISGLTVADELRGKSILVLEASNRIGGRIYTDRTRYKGQVERGAEYIHIDPIDTPLWRKVSQYKLKMVKVKKINSYVFHSDLESEGILSTISTVFKLGFLNVLQIFNRLNYKSAVDLSAEEFLSSLKQTVNSKKDKILLDFKRMILSGHLGAPEDRLSMNGFRLDHISEQLQAKFEYYIRNGYGSLVDQISRDINIQLQEPVAKVTKIMPSTSNNNFIYQVTTETGKIYTAKSVCYSASIGVLKSNQIEFSPALPTKKILAIQQLEMSHHTKIHLEFTERFWPNDMTMVNRIDQRRRMGKTYFVAYSDVPGALPTLTALISGNDAIKLYSMTKEEMIENICLDLEECFPEMGDIYKLLNVDADGKPNVMLTQWNKNKFVRGGISYIKVNRENSFPVELVRPTYASSEETPGLFWAGEAAAIYEQPASVHGAYSAGLRASVEIENFLNGNELKDEKKIAQIYHEKFGFKNTMDWHADITRTPQNNNDDEQAWQDKFVPLFD